MYTYLQTDFKCVLRPLPFNTLASVAVEGAIFNQLQILVDCFYLNLRIFKKYIVDIVQGKIFHL